MKSWTRDKTNPAKVTLIYTYTGTNEGDEEEERTFVPVKYREAAPA